MKCLFVKAPFAGWIVDGVKLVEFRTRNTSIRGRIGIIESGTKTVIGDVEITGCKHDKETGLYFWFLKNGRRYAEPVPYQHKRGSIIWTNVEIDPHTVRCCIITDLYHQKALCEINEAIYFMKLAKKKAEKAQEEKEKHIKTWGYHFLDHPQKQFYPGSECFVPVFAVSPMGDQLFLYSWEGTVKEIFDKGREAIIEPRTPGRCPSIVSVAMLGHDSHEAKCRMIEWAERFVDAHRQDLFGD